ncbi:MAG TPA: cation:proton antiporter, partial [Oscillatoriaceae cyanobacterium]
MASILHEYATSTVVLTTAAVLLVGVAAQLLARRLELPVILFLLGAGVALGPYGLGWIQPALYGSGLRAVVAISVAVIVFQGAMAIDLRHLIHTSRSVISLASIGALTTLALAAVATHYLVGYPWLIAALFGAIVCVTGPTVIGPVLARLPLHRRLKTILEAESVLVDAIGVLLTAAVFSYITGSTGGVLGGLLQLGINLVIGVGLGLALGGLLALVLQRQHTWPSGHVRLLVLAVALLCYGVSESLAHESGIAAVATAGLVFGSVKSPSEETIKQFTGDLQQIALSLVFILLAASVDLSRLRHFGWPELAVVLILMFLVRPFAVGLATLGSALNWREKAFIAWMGPRGVVATAMASLMS